MKLYLYTPLHNNSKIIPHLLEHCISQNIDPKQYFQHFWYLNATCWNNFTSFDDVNDIEAFLQLLQKTPSKETIDYEISIIKEEMENKHYGAILGDKIGKQLYGKSFQTNTSTIASYKQVREYHKQYYQNPSYIITDDENKITEIHNINKKQTKNSISPLQKTIIKYLGNQENVFYKEINNQLDIYHIYFITELYASFTEFYYRYKKGIYNHDEVYYHLLPQHMAVSINHIDKLSITEGFFQAFKKAFIKDLNHKSSRIWQIFCVFYLGQHVDLEEIKNYYKTLSLENLLK